MMALRLVPDCKFEFIHLDDNLTREMMIGADLTTMVKKSLVECLRDNVDLSIVSSHEMYDIDLSVACHQLNISWCTIRVQEEHATVS